jgi:Holliday junction resolvase RusA-like endonuclease
MATPDIEVNIKPLSVNKAYKGRKRKTHYYKQYEDELLNLLPAEFKVPARGKIKIELEFYVSSPLADIDNPLKPLIDILQKKYGFNDKRIFILNVNKFLVAKGDEGIHIKITSIRRMKNASSTRTIKPS